jgi:V/A-type H+-transporting ATPase subunit A
VTAHTQRFVRSLWSLDRDLAAARHYPAVGWRESFARDADVLAAWHLRHGDPAWTSRRRRAMALLAESDRLESVVQLLGVQALPDRERIVRLSAQLLREGVLQQSAAHPNDEFATPEKLNALVDMVLAVHRQCLELLQHDTPASMIEEVDLSDVVRAREAAGPDGVEAIARIRDEALQRLSGLA